MEPPLGQVSFFLLCMQYARAQLQNIGAKPYTEWLLERRSGKLMKEFPKYDRDIVTSYSKGVPINK
jgi:mRNA deadenylase 3'-5' endonuclease subunit Ccr4